MVSTNCGWLHLFDRDERHFYRIEVQTGYLEDLGAVPGPWNHDLDFAAIHYERELEAWIQAISTSSSRVALKPKGMLPFATTLEILMRNRVVSLAGISAVTSSSMIHELGGIRVGAFTTYDPGSGPVDDRFLEDFTDNDFESTSLEFGKGTASWNYNDLDGKPPAFEHLVATYGLGGSGELGDFLPTANFPVINFDTDYQTLPLLDGSTPQITDPVAIQDGQFNFRNIDIPDGVEIYARGSNPLTFTATGDVTIAGVIDVSGLEGMSDDAFDSGYIPVPGGLGGPGAGRGWYGPASHAE